MFRLPKLSYSTSSLEPFLSSETFLYHYEKHHKTYIDNTNAMIRGTEFENASLEQIVLQSHGPLFANASQAWNHAFYWKSMRPLLDQANSIKPPLELERKIDEAFGDLNAFQERFIDAILKVLGSGSVWLVVEPDRKLKIVSFPNAESPMKSGLIPILTCDVWEHAYYIDYRNNRRRYAEGFMTVINWGFAFRNFKSGKFPDMTASMKYELDAHPNDPGDF